MPADSVFLCKGKPFFSLGAQAYNSSGYTMEELEPLWEACRLMHANTCAVAVSWERIEPEEGCFSTSIVGEIIRRCKKESLKLVLLWFGAWKNGHMKYVPGWVKKDRERFPRVLTHDGYEIANLSSFHEETFSADCRAFCELLKAAKEADSDEEILFAVQIENEAGIAGRALRDYGEAAQQHFEEPVPSFIIENMKQNPNEPISMDWQQCGALSKGSWQRCYGRRGDELLQAYSIACYIDRMAAEGKKILSLPMYVNVWVDRLFHDVPGIDYPSGAAVSKNLALWKWCTPHIDMICPDMYCECQKEYVERLQIYTRRDNPLFIPETHCNAAFAMGMFRAIADYGLTGIHFFAAESVLSRDGLIKPEALPMKENFQCIRAVEALVLKMRGSEKLKSVIQEEFAYEQLLTFDGWNMVARFGEYERDGDYRHIETQTSKRGRALVFQTRENEFYACGVQTTLLFRKNPGLLETVVPQENWQQENFINYLSVEEGFFDEDCNWHITRIRNGDQTDFGIYLFPDNGAVRIVLD